MTKINFIPMKIAIISDTHDNITNLEKFLNWARINNIEALIHAGDVSAPSVLSKTLAPNFSGSIHLIFGNVGDPMLLKKVAEELKNVNYYGEAGMFEINGLSIALVHQPERAESYIASGGFDLVIYGHTHQSEIKRVGNTMVINPGTLGGLFNEPTFAVYDTVAREANIFQLNNLS